MKKRLLAALLLCGTMMAQSDPTERKEDPLAHELAVTKAKLAMRDAQLAQAQAQIAQLQAQAKISTMQDTIATEKKSLGLDPSYDWNYQSEDFIKNPKQPVETKK